MSKIRNVTLAPELNELLVALLGKTREDMLAHVGKNYLSGGFTHPDAIRERLIAKVRSNGTLEPWLLGLLNQTVPGGRMVNVLSVQGLRAVFDSLATLTNRRTLTMACLLDAREDVHNFGAEKLAEGLEQPPDSEKKAASNTLFQFVDQNLLLVTDVTVTPKPEVTKPEASGKKAEKEEEVDIDDLFRVLTDMRKVVERQQKTIEKLERNLQDQGRKQKSKLELAARHAADEKKHLVTEREQFRTKFLRMTRERDTLAKQVQELSANQQTVIAQDVAQQTSTVVRKWLIAPLEAEQHLEQLNVATGDLLTRAQQALEAQARQDRFSGNRLELERHLAQLRETRERLTGAAQNALAPLAQLREVLSEVEEKIAHTEKILAGQRGVDPFTDRLLIAINKAATWDEVHQHSELLDQLAESDLVRKEDRRRLYDAVQRKLSLLEEGHRHHGAEAPEQGWSLRDAIFRNRPSLLILDGHNLLFGLEDIFRPDYDENGRPGRKARERLVNIVRRLADGRPNLRARICFDAPQHEIVTIGPNIEIEFSGGKGEHRADHRIGERVTWRRPEELDQKWFVVTDDRAVRRQAVKNGAHFVPLDLFAVLLSDFHCLQESPKVAA